MEEQSVSIVTLGCARNEVDSEELAGRLDADGFTVVDDPHDAETVLVNTCGFVDQAKTDSINEVLATAELKKEGATKAVIAVGCLSERYGVGLANELHEADAILGFDDYPDIGDRIRSVLAGEKLHPLYPVDRRTTLPLAPAARQAARVAPDLPDGVAPASGPRAVRRRLDGGPTAPVKLAGGCDRRCSFCAIPRWRGAFVSRRPSELIDEAEWLAGQGVRELFLVSENSTSYGKDLGDLRLLETLLPELAGIEGIERVRVSYLQPAEMRPSLVEAICAADGVVPYFDLSFQHASAGVLRRMRRFGSRSTFLDLLGQIRALQPLAGVRTNVIVGFPGESERDLRELERFLTEARLDVIGVFGYSDEDGTEAAGFDGKLDPDEVAERVEWFQNLADELVSQRAEDRIGETVEVLVESPDGEGRAAHQGPDVDGTTTLQSWSGSVGEIVTAKVVSSEGADLIATPLP